MARRIYRKVERVLIYATAHCAEIFLCDAGRHEKWN
jgi:hypothetical protein